MMRLTAKSAVKSKNSYHRDHRAHRDSEFVFSVNSVVKKALLGVWAVQPYFNLP